MKSRLLIPIGLSVMIAAAAGVNLRATETNDAPRFQEIYDLLRQNLAEVKDTELNRAAVEGIISKLQPYVAIVNPKEIVPEFSNETVVLSKTSTYDDYYGYIRIHQVNRQLVQQLMGALDQLKSTNTLKGLVLDLRFASGQDYAAAAQTAELFIASPKPLLKWGDNQVSSTPKTNAFTLPLVVLVNQKTAGAAEALAGALRQTDTALLIGSNTAGRAVIYQDYPLRNGEVLRIASTLVRLGDGSILPITGVKPDIQVSVSSSDEIAFYSDAYTVLSKSATNLAGQLIREGQALNRSPNTNRPRPRFNEAELVRMKKEGQNPEEIDGSLLLPSSPEPNKPTLQDPALARGIDLLKGLAVVRKAR